MKISKLKRMLWPKPKTPRRRMKIVQRAMLRKLEKDMFNEPPRGRTFQGINCTITVGGMTMDLVGLDECIGVGDAIDGSDY